VDGRKESRLGTQRPGQASRCTDLVLHLHNSLGAASPVSDRVGLHSLPAALLAALLLADGLMMIQPESLHDLSRMMCCGIYFLRSQMGCMPLIHPRARQLKLGVRLA
jgi:hypothetical protein